MAWNEPGNNNRDPWNPGGGGGKGGGARPPDFNELFKRLRARWGNGRQRSGLILLVGAFLVLCWLLAGFYTVNDGEYGLVTRLGAYSHTDQPGLNWHLPPPFEHVKMVNVGVVRQVPAVPQEMLTRDQNLVQAGVALQFKVVSAEDYAFNNVDNPEDILALASASALQQVIGRHGVDEVVGGGSGANAIANDTRQLLQQILDSYHSGIQLTAATLKVEPPDALKPDFADAIRAAEDRKSQRNDAQAYADSRVPAARADAARDISAAQAYRDQVIARAEGDVARFSAVLQEYRRSPQVTRKRLYLDTMSDIYARSGKVLVDVDKGNPSFTVPVQQLQQAPAEPPKNAEAAPPGSPPAAGPGAAPAPAPGDNAEDNARSRSRGGR